MRYTADSEATATVGPLDRHTFVTPFIISTFLAFPSLLVVAYSKQTIGYDLLIASGYYQLIMAVLAVLLSVSLVTSLLYLWRSCNHAAKVAVVIVEVVAVASFLYITVA